MTAVTDRLYVKPLGQYIVESMDGYRAGSKRS
jgi:hypothetical protein